MRKNVNHKALVALLGLLMLFSTAMFVFPIRASNLKPSAGVDLTIWVTDQQLPGVTNVTDDFLNSDLGTGVNSVTVKSTGTTADNQLINLQTLMQGGTATADVIGLDVVWTALFASNGWIIPLDSYLTSGELNDYGSGIVAAGQYKGKTYAYPYFMNLGILFYRRDLMDRFFGVGKWSEADFSTWEGLNETANFILNNGSGMLLRSEGDLGGYVGQFDNYEGGVVNFFEWCGSNGMLDVVTSEGAVNIDTEGVTKAMEFVQALVPPQYTGVQGNLTQFNETGLSGAPNSAYNNYIIPRAALTYDEGSSVGAWLAGNAIFMRQWPFAYGGSITAGMDFGVAPLPHFEGVTGYKTSCVGGAILAIPKATTGDARDAAVNLIKYLGDKKAQEAELIADTDKETPGVQALANFPALLSVYANPPSGFEWIKNWTDQASLTLSRPVQPKYPEISNKIGDYFTLILTGKSVADQLAGMQKDVKEIVAGAPTQIPGYSVAIIVLSIASIIGIIIISRKKFK
ncbi:MAG: extracellular solute-binding protein [Promethearchaeota archaeon]